MEHEVLLDIYKVEYVCETCYNGTMDWDHIIPDKHKDQLFNHFCTNCGAKKVFTVVYPGRREKPHASAK